jgi:salicylate hydroxylase
MYNGPNAHVITYPVALGAVLNVLAVITDANPWGGEDGKHTAAGTKSEATDAFKSWHPTVRAIVDMLPDNMDKWAIFDMMDNPAPSYVRGRVCVAGDAAHAAGPHLGAGASFGIEDALVLSTVMEAVKGAAPSKPDISKAELLRVALQAYNDVRYERTQWLVEHTRAAVDLFQWRNPNCGSNPEQFANEITWRFHKIWHYDIDAMLQEALNKFASKVN